MKSKKIQFSNARGEKLAARLELPADGHPHTYALFAHCFTCNKNLLAVKNISRALTAKGIAVLRFDFTGLGESEGDFADTDFSSNVADLIAAAQFLETKHEAPELLVGHSLGGAAVLIAGNHLPSVKAIATIGAPYAPEHVTHLFQDELETIQEQGKARVKIAGREFTIKQEFVKDLESIHSLAMIHKLNRPLLVLHSPVDEVVEVTNAAQIYKAAVHPKSYISLDDADHMLSRKQDSLYAGQMIASWSARYLPPKSSDSLQTIQQVAARTGSDGYTTDIRAGNHDLVADEPESVGGNGFGPTPYDLLLSALGSCTSMTLRMYADRKKWDLREVRVHLNHEKKYQEDCIDCENPKSKIDHIERLIELDGDLDETQRQRLLEIADKCPVHKTLEADTLIKTILKE